jgi:coenzyme F420-0:L-glutamate ligase/coenzyme F420-1:gamma-L-glutamate ligase
VTGPAAAGRPTPAAPADAGPDATPNRLEILPVLGIGEVEPGADLAGLITDAAPWLRDGDVLVVTSKIVSKAEGRLVEVPASGPERERARAEVVAAETARTVAARGGTRIVVTQHGFVLASAGVDASNVDTTRLVLLPKDPDGSARALRAALAERYRLRVAVVVSDTMGRPWRNGLIDVALGAAGIAPLRDHRGETDRYGNQLRLTQMAVADELAAAAELVKGKQAQIPVAVVRGLPVATTGDGPGVVATLVRDPAEDLFSLGTAEARAAGLRRAATLPDGAPGGFGPGPVAAAAVREAIATATAGRPGTVLEPVAGGGGAPAAVRCRAADPGDPESLVRLGADVHRLRAALAAEGLVSAARFEPPGTILIQLGHPLPAGDVEAG